MESGSAGLVLVSELHVGRRHDDHGWDIQRHQGLGVGVVPEQHVAAQATGVSGTSARACPIKFT